MPARALAVRYPSVISAWALRCLSFFWRQCESLYLRTSKIQTPRLFCKSLTDTHRNQTQCATGSRGHATHTAMKQLLFFVTALILAVLPVKAQTSQVATLSHEGTITTFYSANALKDAYAAAVDGDVITLSSGSFASVHIEKNITVRGAGMMPDADPTIITGSTTVKCPDSETEHLTLEGFYHNGSFYLNSATDPRIIKCQFTSFSMHNVQNLMAVQSFFDYFSAGKSNGNLFNCLTKNARYDVPDGIISLAFTNCIFWLPELSVIGNSVLKNCIIGDPTHSVDLPSSTMAYYCYYFGKSSTPFQHCPTTTNVVMKDWDIQDVFTSNILWTLKDELQTTWLGEDGTQVGIYGGLLPFDPTPTNPQITKFNVASKTTADGKLSVDIEVKAN